MVRKEELERKVEREREAILGFRSIEVVGWEGRCVVVVGREVLDLFVEDGGGLEEGWRGGKPFAGAFEACGCIDNEHFFAVGGGESVVAYAVWTVAGTDEVFAVLVAVVVDDWGGRGAGGCADRCSLVLVCAFEQPSAILS